MTQTAWATGRYNRPRHDEQTPGVPVEESDQVKHRMIVALDVERFGDPQRNLFDQSATRDALYRAVREAFDGAGIPLGACHVEDRGDGIFILVPPEFSKFALLEAVPTRLARVLRVHNLSSPVTRRIRLRMAVNAGEVLFDEQGVTSTSINATFRFLDSAHLRTALDNSSGVIALAVSSWIFHEVVRHSRVIDPGAFTPVTAEVKEFSGTVWISLPDRPDAPELGEPASGGIDSPDGAATTHREGSARIALWDNKGVQVGNHNTMTLNLND